MPAVAGEAHNERRSRGGLRAMGEVENESIFASLRSWLCRG
jgi:hypothetical protein